METTAVPPKTPLRSSQKAAVLLIMLGEQRSSELIRHLDAEEVERLSRTISSVDSIDSREAEDVLEEYVSMTQARQYVVRGGADYARRMLTGVLGKEGASTLIDRFTQADADSAGERALAGELAHIEAADPHQLAGLLAAEHPQAAAIILSKLVSVRAAAVLRALPPSSRSDVALRLASLDRVSPDVLRKIAEVIGKKLHAGKEMTGSRSGGVHAVAEVFNHMDSATAEESLGVMSSTDPNMAELIRHHMFLFEDIASLGKDGMQELVARVDRAVLTIALKGTSENLRASVLQCMSQRGGEMLREDMEAAGPARIRDVEKAQKQVVALVRQMQREGVISTAGEQYVT